MHIGGFTVHNSKHPVKGHIIEDAFVAKKVQKKICLVVADGITRDPLPVLPDKNTPVGARLWKKHYPNPSPAYEIARRSCDAFAQSLHRFAIFHMWDALGKVNERVRKYNQEHFPHPDFLVNDEAGCQLAYAVFYEGKLWYGSLSSCGIAVLDRPGSVCAKTPDTYWPHDRERHAFLQQAGLKLFASGHGVWEQPETRYILRSTFRNQKIPGGYGIITGDSKALDFIEMGEREVYQGEQVLAYTDSMAELLFVDPSEEQTSLREEVKPFFTHRDFKGLEQHCKQHVKSEGTLAYFVE